MSPCVFLCTTSCLRTKIACVCVHCCQFLEVAEQHGCLQAAKAWSTHMQKCSKEVGFIRKELESWHTELGETVVYGSKGSGLE